MGLVQKHRALNPFGAQVQVSNRAIVGKVDFGEGRCAFFQDGAIIPKRCVEPLREPAALHSHERSEQPGRRHCLAPGRELAIKTPTGIGRAGGRQLEHRQAQGGGVFGVPKALAAVVGN